MSFIKDLVAWKARANRDDFAATNEKRDEMFGDGQTDGPADTTPAIPQIQSLPTVADTPAPARAEIASDLPAPGLVRAGMAETGNDWDDDLGILDVDTTGSPVHTSATQAASAAAVRRPPPRAASPVVPPVTEPLTTPEQKAAALPPASQTEANASGGSRRNDSGEVEAILARVAQRNASRAARAVPGTELRSVIPSAPPKIWELNVGPIQPQVEHAPEPAAPKAPKRADNAETGHVVPQDLPTTPGPHVSPAPAPAATSAPKPPGGRVKTRLLGFHHPGAVAADPFDAPTAVPHAAVAFPTGWVVVISGPGRGACFTLQSGVSQIGRGEDQAIRLDFGDMSISRNNHAAIAYDEEMTRFYLGHGGKLNLVRLNGKPVLSTEEVKNNDQIRIGETTLKFVALCGDDFTWAEDVPGTKPRGNDGTAG